MAKRAVLYLRSSKDRHDVSVESQRRELQRYVSSCGDILVDEFIDKVESAKTANRPAFQDMMAEVKSKQCRFTIIYCYDTSRFSRRMYDAQLYKHLLKKNDIELVFLKLPKSDPLMDSVLESLMEIFDEFHSQKSKMDGLRGMRENVQQGWRAGGRAPVGYCLEKTVVGSRDGEPVTKSKLIPDPKSFYLIKEYLKGVVNGIARMHLVRELGIDIPKTSLIYIEEGALTYAGHTVWNRHNECVDGKYKGGNRYRDRKDWVIQRDTHEAMISDEEAEAILSKREEERASRKRRRISIYLLTGIVTCRCGANFIGEGGYYRCQKRCGNRGIKKDTLEQIFIEMLFQNLFSPENIEAVKNSIEKKSRKSASKKITKEEELRKKLKSIEKEINGIVDLIQKVKHKRSLLTKLDSLEEERVVIESQMDKVDRSSVPLAINVNSKDIICFMENYKKTFHQINIERKKSMLNNCVGSAILDGNLLIITPKYEVITGMKSSSKAVEKVIR
ncbi:hypothetical protein MMIC_P2125 [Mariprofundus micogutta]|uniref:Resolvase/invertase-type recombinase catalytic domain-containing protein n=1 Tax=Mariprofundus micogutta TaxID=1921010 RepID=A0A1L8CQE3_9PROT|nr:recombinase family protein [Mariprofundus micogutta]GAV21145.1 hypothetical protein MMIC_P2125 [Mariprofundus micogutta]